MADINNVFRVEGLSIDDITGVFGGSEDPTAGYAAPLGSLFLRTTGEHFVKFGAADTDWKKIALKESFDALKEPTGIDDRTQSVVSWDDGTRTWTISPAVDKFNYYIHGELYEVTTPKSITISDVEGIHFIYFNTNGDLIDDLAPPPIPGLLLEHCYVAAMYWNVATQTAVYMADERHGTVMDGMTHMHFHTTYGTQYVDGLALTSLVTDDAGDLPSHAQLQVEPGSIRDEDLHHVIIDGNSETTQSTLTLEQPLLSPAELPVLYRYGTTGEFRIKAADTYPFIYHGTAGFTDPTNNLPAWNEWTGTTWQLATMPDDSYFYVHILATNDWRHPIVSLLGTSYYDTRPSGAGTPRAELAEMEGMPFEEWVLVGSVLLHASTSYLNVPKAATQKVNATEDWVDWRNAETFGDQIGSSTLREHSNLNGLELDDHTQYHTDARADAWLTTKDSHDIRVPSINGAPNDTVQDVLRFVNSSGVVAGGGIVDNGNGTITVAAGHGYIRLGTNDDDLLYNTAWSSAVLGPFDENRVYYIEVTVTPQDAVTGVAAPLAVPDVRPNCNSHIHLGQIYRHGTHVHVFDEAKFLVGDHIRHLVLRLEETGPFAHASGGYLGESGTRNISITGGVFWQGLTRFLTNAIDTSLGDTFEYYYRDGLGSWSEMTAQTQIDNTYYDDGSGTLAPLTSLNYGVHWVYVGADDHGVGANEYFVVYGQGDYTLQEAQDAPIPTPPEFVTFHGKLIGKIIIQQGASSFTSVQSTLLDNSVAPTAVTDHNNLINKGVNTHAEIDSHIDDPILHLNTNSTGLISGGELSINGVDNTTFDVTAGTGIIVDNHTDPNNPTLQSVSWNALTGVTVTDLATEDLTFVAINSSGTILQQSTPFTNAQHKEYIVLGLLGHSNNTNIVLTVTVTDPTFNVAGRISDLGRSLGAFNVEGNVFQPAISKTMSKTTGKTYSPGSNFFGDKRDIDVVEHAAAVSTTFIYSRRNGTGGFTLSAPGTTVDTANYDDGSGTLAAVPTNKWTVQIVRIYPVAAATPEITVEYGQKLFDSKAEAIDLLPDPDFVSNPQFENAMGIIRAFIVVQEGATDLTDTAQCIFVEASKFEQNGNGQVSGSVTSLQKAYNNSTPGTTEITLDASHGGIAIQQGAGLTGSILTLQDDTPITVFDVDTSGNLTVTDLSKLNGVDSTLTPADGHQLYYNGTSGQWESARLTVPGTKQTIQSTFDIIPSTSGTTVIPITTTAPLITDGSQLWSKSFTPSASNAEIKIHMSFAFAVTNASSNIVVTVFRDNTAIGAMVDTASSSGGYQTVSLIIKDPGPFVAGTPVTYSARVGKSGGNATWYINTNATAQHFGNTLANNAYTIEEVVTIV